MTESAACKTAKSLQKILAKVGDGVVNSPRESNRKYGIYVSVLIKIVLHSLHFNRLINFFAVQPAIM